MFGLGLREVLATTVGAEAVEQADEQRQRVEDVDDGRHVGDGERERADDHHYPRKIRYYHHLYTAFKHIIFDASFGCRAPVSAEYGIVIIIERAGGGLVRLTITGNISDLNNVRMSCSDSREFLLRFWRMTR